MAKAAQSASEDNAERSHCAEVVNAPNPFGVRSTVHFCLTLHAVEGETIRDVVINLDRWSLSAAIALEIERDPDAQSRIEAIVVRSAASEYLRGSRPIRWQGEHLD